MSHRVFFLNRLRDGVSAADYERWARDVGAPFARSVPSITSYVVTRLVETLDGNGTPPYDFVEIVEVDDLDAYKADLSTDRPEIEAFDEEWFKYVGEAVAVIGEVIE